MHAHHEPESSNASSLRRRHQPESDRSEPNTGGGLTSDTVLALQRTIGNTAVARLLADEEEEEAVQRSAVHQVLHQSGRPLDEDVQADMEARFGTDFSHVRVHTDSTAHAAADSVQAHAFTSGSHIVFQRSRYDPDTSAGKQMLAHELTHVIQQRSGPVDGTRTADGLSVSDPGDRFEQEAESTATRVMSSPGGHEGQPVPEASGQRHAGPVPVARIMSEEDFKAATADTGIRGASDVTTIDDAVRAFHRTRREQYRERADKLKTIITRCQVYLQKSQNARRKSGVQRLLEQAMTELETYQAMAFSETLNANPVEKFSAIAHALDAALRQEATNPETTGELGLLDIPSKLQRLAAGMSQAEFGELAQNHVEILKGLQGEPNLPAETAAILAEVLSYTDQISFESGAPQGTSIVDHTKPGQPPEKYRFRAAMGHRGGSAERAGYFAHEMTHVAAHEAFNNTALMLLFQSNIQDDELRGLIQRRADTLDQLRTAFNNNTDAFTPIQQDLVEEKLTYGGDPTRVQRYVSTFRTAGKIDQSTADRVNHWISLVGDRTGLMVEYDTVLNQMLVYMQMWNIDASNAFYVRLRQAAQAALDYRNTARATTARATTAGSSGQAAGP